MTIQRLFLRRLIAIFVFSTLAGPVLADEAGSRLPNKFVLSFKSGYLDLVDTSQEIAGAARRFDESSNIWAVEGEWREPGEKVSFGGEVLHYNNRYKRESTPGSNFEEKMQTHALLLKSKYFLGPTEHWQPYVGLGVGLVNAYDSTGAIEGTADGVGIQGVVGMQFRSTRVGFRLEYMYLHSTLDDDKGDEIDVSSNGVMLGLSLYMGRRPR